MQTHPAVQSILTADTLIQHYVRAVEKVGRSLGRDKDEFDVQLADANRVYPTIWEHLDRARDLLAGEGREMWAFDRVRAAAGQGTVLGANVDRGEIQISVNIFGQLTQTQSISVSFNLAGVQLAYEANVALKNAMPEVDWTALQLQADIPPEDLKRGANLKWAIAVVVLIAGFIAFLKFF